MEIMWSHGWLNVNHFQLDFGLHVYRLLWSRFTISLIHSMWTGVSVGLDAYYHIIAHRNNHFRKKFLFYFHSDHQFCPSLYALIIWKWRNVKLWKDVPKYMEGSGIYAMAHMLMYCVSLISPFFPKLFHLINFKEMYRDWWEMVIVFTVLLKVGWHGSKSHWGNDWLRCDCIVDGWLLALKSLFEKGWAWALKVWSEWRCVVSFVSIHSCPV